MSTISLPPADTPHRGSLRLLEEPLTALFCSNRCPGDLILNTYDLAWAMRGAGVPVIGGFQTPMEKECLRLLLRGSQPVVVCPGSRHRQHARAPRVARLAGSGPDASVVALSGHPDAGRRADLAALRNDMVAELAHSCLYRPRLPRR